jgi:hypothetical protein
MKRRAPKATAAEATPAMTIPTIWGVLREPVGCGLGLDAEAGSGDAVTNVDLDVEAEVKVDENEGKAGVPVSTAMPVPEKESDGFGRLDGRALETGPVAVDNVEETGNAVAAMSVAVMVEWVAGRALGSREHTEYACVFSSACSGQSETTQRRAASPSVKPVVVLVEQRQSMSWVLGHA